MWQKIKLKINDNIRKLSSYVYSERQCDFLSMEGNIVPIYDIQVWYAVFNSVDVPEQSINSNWRYLKIF